MSPTSSSLTVDWKLDPNVRVSVLLNKLNFQTHRSRRSGSAKTNRRNIRNILTTHSYTYTKPLRLPPKPPQPTLIPKSLNSQHELNQRLKARQVLKDWCNIFTEGTSPHCNICEQFIFQLSQHIQEKHKRRLSNTVVDYGSHFPNHSSNYDESCSPSEVISDLGDGDSTCDNDNCSITSKSQFTSNISKEPELEPSSTTTSVIPSKIGDINIPLEIETTEVFGFTSYSLRKVKPVNYSEENEKDPLENIQENSNSLKSLHSNPDIVITKYFVNENMIDDIDIKEEEEEIIINNNMEDPDSDYSPGEVNHSNNLETDSNYSSSSQDSDSDSGTKDNTDTDYNLNSLQKQKQQQPIILVDKETNSNLIGNKSVASVVVKRRKIKLNRHKVTGNRSKSKKGRKVTGNRSWKKRGKVTGNSSKKKGGKVKSNIIKAQVETLKKLKEILLNKTIRQEGIESEEKNHDDSHSSVVINTEKDNSCDALERFRQLGEKYMRHLHKITPGNKNVETEGENGQNVMSASSSSSNELDKNETTGGINQKKTVNGEGETTIDESVHPKIKCNFCSRIYLTKKSLNNHLRKSHLKELIKQYKCPWCDNEYYNSGVLNKHVRENHEGLKPYICTICNQSFKLPNLLKRHHVRIHSDSGIKPHSCKYCNKSFYCKSKMRRHERTHTGEKPYQCKICLKSLANTKTLNLHNRIHTGEKPYMCEHCSICFRTKTGLTSHMYLHNDDKKFTCEHCNKQFRFPSNLKSHYKIHTEIKDHICELCGKCFRLPHNLRAHLKTHK